MFFFYKMYVSGAGDQATRSISKKFAAKYINQSIIELTLLLQHIKVRLTSEEEGQTLAEGKQSRQESQGLVSMRFIIILISFTITEKIYITISSSQSE